MSLLLHLMLMIKHLSCWSAVSVAHSLSLVLSHQTSPLLSLLSSLAILAMHVNTSSKLLVSSTPILVVGHHTLLSSLAPWMEINCNKCSMHMAVVTHLVVKAISHSSHLVHYSHQSEAFPQIFSHLKPWSIHQIPFNNH